MAIQSYSDLTATVADYLERQDLSSQIETFVQLGEAHLSRRLKLRTMELDVVLTATPGSASLDLPANYSEPRQLWWDDGSRRWDMRAVLPGSMNRDALPARPYFWGIDGGSITFERPCDQAYTFVFRFLADLDIAGSGGVTALLMQLSPWQPANFVLLNYPDAYLQAALAEAYDYLQDDARQAKAEAKRDEIIAEINAKEGRSKAITPLRTEISRQMLGQRSTFNIRQGQ